MRLILKNAEAAYVDVVSIPNRLIVNIDGIETDDILIHIDIIEAIKYYGVTELLDTIGEEQLKSHLKSLKSLF